MFVFVREPIADEDEDDKEKKDDEEEEEEYTPVTRLTVSIRCNTSLHNGNLNAATSTNVNVANERRPEESTVV